AHVVEPACVVHQALVGASGLPDADGALALGGDDVDGALVVDPAPGRRGGFGGRHGRGGVPGVQRVRHRVRGRGTGEVVLLGNRRLFIACPPAGAGAPPRSGAG